MTILDPVTGPLSREKFAELVAAPYGAAKKEIRKYDPYYRLETGEKVRFRVEAKGRMRGIAYIEARSQEEANKLADALSDASFDWQDTGSGFDIVEVEPDTL